VHVGIVEMKSFVELDHCDCLSSAGDACFSSVGWWVVDTARLGWLSVSTCFISVNVSRVKPISVLELDLADNHSDIVLFAAQVLLHLLAMLDCVFGVGAHVMRLV